MPGPVVAGLRMPQTRKAVANSSGHPGPPRQFAPSPVHPQYGYNNLNHNFEEEEYSVNEFVNGNHNNAESRELQNGEHQRPVPKPRKNSNVARDSHSAEQIQTRSNTVTSERTSDPEEGDAVNVVIRVRPISQIEVQRKDKTVVQFPGDGAVWIDSGFQNKSFTFNVTFEPEAKQEDVFEHSGVKKLVEMALNGYSCTAFAFGQTGSGKTHTITGPPEMFCDGHLRTPPEDVGLIPRSFQHLFKLMKQQPRSGFRITASYLEIYNEQVQDLLNGSAKRNLAVRWSKNKGFYVENLFHVECESIDDLMAVLEEGLRNRATGSNSANEHSSRSHSMLTLHLDSDQQDPDDENLYITKHGKLTFVDLAGSEKTKNDQVSDPNHLVESNNINRSLLVLGNCISALGDKGRRQGHIPYRDSKLTKLLADSLGGNGVTLMIACVSPTSSNAAESINTLRYANRAKKIKTKPIITMDPREKLILSLKRESKILRQENHYLRQQLEFPVKPRGQLQRENDEKFLLMLKQYKSEGKASDHHGLYEMLQEYMVENEQLRNENSTLFETKSRSQRDQQMLARENERLLRRLEAMGREQMMQGTPLSMYSVQSSRHSSAIDGFYHQTSPTHTPPQYRNHPGPSPRQVPKPFGGPKRPPHRLNEPLNKHNPAYIEPSVTQSTPRNYQHVQPQHNPHYNYHTSSTHPHPQGFVPTGGGLGSPQLSRAAPGGAVDGSPGLSTVGSPKRNNRGGLHTQPRRDGLHTGQHSPGGPYRQQHQADAEIPSTGESVQDMNERLRQELLELEGQIRNQSNANTPQQGASHRQHMR